MKKIAINGLGRIGRMVLRHYMNNPVKDIEIVAANDLVPPENLHICCILIRFTGVPLTRLRQKAIPLQWVISRSRCLRKKIRPASPGGKWVSIWLSRAPVFSPKEKRPPGICGPVQNKY